MLRILLIITGFVIMIVQQYVFQIPDHWQYIGFVFGIVLVGIPHGSADVLVASKNARNGRAFSGKNFLLQYIGRLLLFATLLFLFPFLGLLIFIIFAAYHFGETDLYFFQTEHLPGKMVVVSYGFVILSVIIFSNLNELKLLLLNAGLHWENTFIYNLVFNYRSAFQSFSVILFFATLFFYFIKTGYKDVIPDSFMIQFALLVVILYNLPLVTGFTFYFIIWHSVLSLKNIISYLKSNGLNSVFAIFKQISFYSILALLGIVICGMASFMFVNNQRIIMWIFGALAVLTAPHMEVMHSMYKNIRIKK